jgi:hypothetical protein
MTTTTTGTFEALGHCVDRASLAERQGVLHTGVAGDAYRELWAVRRLLEAARLVVRGADWEWDPGGDPPRAPVARHDLVLLEAAALLARGERAGTADGFPHAGAEVGDGRCEAGFCPCHDEHRPPQPALLKRAA